MVYRMHTLLICYSIWTYWSNAATMPGNYWKKIHYWKTTKACGIKFIASLEKRYR